MSSSPAAPGGRRANTRTSRWCCTMQRGADAMNALAAARLHLGKAREFLDAADLEHERKLFNAATSNAVLSGINSKDAICLKLAGRSTKSEDHGEAARELAATGARDERWLPCSSDFWRESRNPSIRQRASGPRMPAERSNRWHASQQPVTVGWGGRVSRRGRATPAGSRCRCRDTTSGRAPGCSGPLPSR